MGYYMLELIEVAVFLIPLIWVYFLERHSQLTLGRKYFIGNSIFILIVAWLASFMSQGISMLGVYLWRENIEVNWWIQNVLDAIVSIVTYAFLYSLLVRRIRSTSLRPVWAFFLLPILVGLSAKILNFYFLSLFGQYLLLAPLVIIAIYALIPARKMAEEIESSN